MLATNTDAPASALVEMETPCMTHKLASPAISDPASQGRHALLWSLADFARVTTCSAQPCTQKDALGDALIHYREYAMK